MIKGLLNAMGLRSGDTVLDPMMGSGTVLIEAALMGMSSVGLDASPFCRFMVQVKLDGFSVPLQPVRDALTNSRKLFEEFSRLAESRNRRRRTRAANDDLFSGQATSSAPARAAAFDGENAFDNVQRFLLLAYLDAAGYSERSQRKSPYDQFRAILERYLFVAEKIQRVLGGAESEIGEAKVLLGDARDLPLPDASVDGVVFSPPYSFAIDYLENDAFHLDFLRVNRETLRESMIGLRGSTLAEKFGLYKKDMTAVLSECARVLRHGRICTIVVGTNNNQLSKILEVPPEEVPGIDDLLVEIAAPMGLKLIRKLSRQITGMANTMRTEFILLLERSN
jgi:ubiquinone/menaquinone biosynthesis C-methylase UbiE